MRSVVEKLFQFMNLYIIKHDRSAISTIQNYQGFQELVHISMLKTENYLVRFEVGKRLRELVIACSGDESLKPTVTALLQAVLIDTLPLVEDHERRCEEYFTDTRRMVEGLALEDLETLRDDFLSLIDTLAASIQAREIKETDTKSEDKILVGLMYTLQVLLQKYPAKKKEIGAKLVPHLLNDCLFEIPHGSGLGH